MQGKSIQDDKKKFIAEMQCNKEADQNKLWVRARDRVDADGLYYGFMECVKAAEVSRRRGTRKQVNHCTTHCMPLRGASHVPMMYNLGCHDVHHAVLLDMC